MRGGQWTGSRIYKGAGKRWKGPWPASGSRPGDGCFDGMSMKAAATTGSRTVDKEYTKGR